MKRRSFLKFLGLGAAVLTLPIGEQNKIIRDKIKNNVKIIASFNVKSIKKTGIGQYCINFDKPLNDVFFIPTISGLSRILNKQTDSITIHVEEKGYVVMTSHSVNRLSAWCKFENVGV